MYSEKLGLDGIVAIITGAGQGIGAVYVPWVKANMAPLRGWCCKGLRLKARAAHGHWKTLTFVSALRVDCVTAPCVFDGHNNGECFLQYVEQVWPAVGERR